MHLGASDSSTSTSDEDKEKAEEHDMSAFAGDSADDADPDIDILAGLASRYNTSRKQANFSGSSFISASAFADALEADPYYGFDIMDFDRPSLRKKSKGRGATNLDDLILSDSDFEHQLHEAWQTDRKKKRAKKKEREELRALGLLGRKSGDPDLRVKYNKGINLEQLIMELRSFLMSTQDRCVCSHPLISISCPIDSRPPLQYILAAYGQAPSQVDSRTGKYIELKVSVPR